MGGGLKGKWTLLAFKHTVEFLLARVKKKARGSSGDLYPVWFITMSVSLALSWWSIVTVKTVHLTKVGASMCSWVWKCCSWTLVGNWIQECNVWPRIVGRTLRYHVTRKWFILLTDFKLKIKFKETILCFPHFLKLKQRKPPFLFNHNLPSFASWPPPTSVCVDSWEPLPWRTALLHCFN